jgi:hypothetical protein
MERTREDRITPDDLYIDFFIAPKFITSIRDGLQVITNVVKGGL